MSTVERSYSFIYKNILKAVNPVKKKIIRTECEVHKFINNQSLSILFNDGRIDSFNLMSKYINEINEGAVWADQDLKSSNHFYNPITGKGLYGNSNAKKECMTYYTLALKEYLNGNVKKSMFYLGAACHLIQDLTIPQHANVELLNNHRSYENWVIKMYKKHFKFKIHQDGIYLKYLIDFIELNSNKAIETYNKYSHIINNHVRFYKITSVILILAQKTTAGLMYKFYYDIQRMKAFKSFKQK